MQKSRSIPIYSTVMGRPKTKAVDDFFLLVWYHTMIEWYIKSNAQSLHLSSNFKDHWIFFPFLIPTILCVSCILCATIYLPSTDLARFKPSISITSTWSMPASGRVSGAFRSSGKSQSCRDAKERKKEIGMGHSELTKVCENEQKSPRAVCAWRDSTTTKDTHGRILYIPEYLVHKAWTWSSRPPRTSPPQHWTWHSHRRTSLPNMAFRPRAHLPSSNVSRVSFSFDLLQAKHGPAKRQERGRKLQQCIYSSWWKCCWLLIRDDVKVLWNVFCCVSLLSLTDDKRSKGTNESEVGPNEHLLRRCGYHLLFSLLLPQLGFWSVLRDELGTTIFSCQRLCEVCVTARVAR